ncbi:phosphoenolpyruvate carboxykinase [Amycolatopsis rhizosphaerae]|uniref:Phosphoenolpyruvate carboxykinase n=1 Tax=Amycolatopsis rhizosphaerae TaxID=2053003 RepID=A0A558CUU6_9PSEU|nr:PEP-utilizing enzyme [Amycolatopsis rhizosphaerae]TVT52548.1 phosphoenolpyruvate carboxykinase [Amycolatopsis rhizosphaerae]
MTEAEPDPLDNSVCDPDVAWTTGNVAEAFPGVSTALGFTFIHLPMERAFRHMFLSLGVFTKADLPVPERIEDQFWTAFAGRAAANISMFRKVARVTPGTSATAIEQQLFGYVRPGTVDDNSARRYPVIMVKAPKTVIRLPKRHDAMFAELRRWRLETLPKIGGLDAQGCLAVLADARDRFHEIMVLHLVVAFVSSGLADQLSAMVTDANLPGLEARLLSGVGSDENEVALDLWRLARQEIDLATFLDRHGYHGPNEGQLHSVTWREDPGPILARLGDYRDIPADSPRAPANRSAEQARLRQEAAAELAATVSPLKRLAIGKLTGLAARFLALREQGKAGYLLTFDVAKAAARRLGALLVDRDVLDDPSDVFHLTYDDLAGGVGSDRRALVKHRLAQYEERCRYQLPQAWEGIPELIPVAADAETDAPAGTQVTGVAASGGVAEGRARVVRDPATVELEDGDILVCETTDPSWVPLFLVAAAVVTDYGGMLSHGPIVARELGLPCVCGTETGSARIRDGQRIRVDGDRGIVEVLESA